MRGFRPFRSSARSQGFGAHDDALAVHGKNEGLAVRQRGTDLIRIEATDVLSRPLDEWFDLTFALMLVGLVGNRLDGGVKRALHRRLGGDFS